MKAIRFVENVQILAFVWAILFGLFAIAEGLTGHFGGFQTCALVCLANIAAFLLNGVTLRRLRARAK